jgi:hypothetical protein
VNHCAHSRRAAFFYALYNDNPGQKAPNIPGRTQGQSPIC